ncbi:MAG TPA: UDP-N-acetylmuramate--L-alanine ligase [Bacteroidia bacterium]|nr:UDP-N-acetylmuramate--L-alanine ligase [Bacteroidia bacterium]
MDFAKLKNVYFLGIGGIGMSALARYFKAMGKQVNGYDKTPTPLTDALTKEGIPVHFKDAVSEIPADVLNDSKERTLLVYTPAIPKDHAEYQHFIAAGYKIWKRSEVLGLITQNAFTIAVAGTHGKTTTSSMIAHLLRSAGVDCSAFLGGITKNYNTNLLIGKNNSKSIVVVEADEYDRSFLTLFPDIAVITSMDADHLDIYGDKNYMEESYRLFAAQVKEGGTLIYRKGLDIGSSKVNKKTADYSVQGKADFFAGNIRIENHRYHFDWNEAGHCIKDLTSEMPGLHNVENAVAAIGVVRQLGISDEQIRKGLSTYTGVKRRFDYQVKSNNVIYIDDYAHHPEELRACIASARELYPGKRIMGIFQPHLFTRTRDFADGFASSLSLLDDLVLLDIYPAREQPIDGVNSKLIWDKVTLKTKSLARLSDFPEALRQHEFDVLLTLGAGDIDQLVNPITEYLQQSE